MLSFPAAIKVYLCTVPCDMRRLFDGLSMMAERIIRCNPLAGYLLVFCNRRTDRLKILYWAFPIQPAPGFRSYLCGLGSHIRLLRVFC
ncbi:MAG: IS66 family insertion sequence element accessory protein TnpB [Acidobacteriia bacterium]|nr:IS66 family insertion sequence element accessory protein TnpB [Terriglobia bacterium]